MELREGARGFVLRALRSTANTKQPYQPGRRICFTVVCPSTGHFALGPLADGFGKAAQEIEGNGAAVGAQQTPQKLKRDWALRPRKSATLTTLGPETVSPSGWEWCTATRFESQTPPHVLEVDVEYSDRQKAAEEIYGHSNRKLA